MMNALYNNSTVKQNGHQQDLWLTRRDPLTPALYNGQGNRWELYADAVSAPSPSAPMASNFCCNAKRLSALIGKLQKISIRR